MRRFIVSDVRQTMHGSIALTAEDTSGPIDLTQAHVQKALSEVFKRYERTVTFVSYPTPCSVRVIVLINNYDDAIAFALQLIEELCGVVEELDSAKPIKE